MKTNGLRVLVACEFSGVVRDAFRRRGFDAWSCDLLPCESDPKWHRQDDVRYMLHEVWDLLIAHPPCTRLANSGVRWLSEPPTGKTVTEMWEEFHAGVEFYKLLRDARIAHRAIENPVMHRYAKEAIRPGNRQVVQPWWFGVPRFKATGFELVNLPPLIPTQILERPLKGTPEYREWSAVHLESPGPDRWKNRSRSFPGVAEAIAEQWGNHLKRLYSIK